MIVYDGPSKLDGKPIVGIVTGATGRGSSNPKTGKMSQLWILRSDIPPHEATKTGDDESVCGQCPLRHHLGGGCYVTPFQVPLAVYRTYVRGLYPLAYTLNPLPLKGRPMRFGAYGDPAALPTVLIKSLAMMVPGWTGYTHQWRTCDQRLRHYFMASVETADDMITAQARGWRTFRARAEDAPLAPDERACPNETHGTACADCRLCDGDAGRSPISIAIRAHGVRAARVQL